MDCWITKTIGSCSPGSCVCRPLWFKKKSSPENSHNDHSALYAPWTHVLHLAWVHLYLHMASDILRRTRICVIVPFFIFYFFVATVLHSVSLKKKIVIVVLFCLLQPYVWTGPSISMCSPLMETAIERPSMCIWTYVMMTTFKATQRNKF